MSHRTFQPRHKDNTLRNVAIIVLILLIVGALGTMAYKLGYLDGAVTWGQGVGQWFHDFFSSSSSELSSISSEVSSIA